MGLLSAVEMTQRTLSRQIKKVLSEIMDGYFMIEKEIYEKLLSEPDVKSKRHSQRAGSKI